MNTWKVVQLSDACLKITDGSHNPPKGVAFSDFLMLSSKNVLDDEITFESPRYLSESDFKFEDQRTGVSDGDVLLTIVGTIGRAAVVESSKGNIALQRSVAVLRPNPSVVDSRFLMFALQHRVEELNAKSRGVAQKGIYLNTLKGLSISIPTLDEQRRIVTVLDEAFAAIATATANSEKNLANARELFNSGVAQIIDAAPGVARSGRLGDIGGRVFTGPFGSLLHKRDYQIGGIPIVNPSHIDDGKIVPSEEKCVGLETAKRLSSYRMKAGDIVVGRRGEMGRCAVVTEAEQGFLCGTGSFFIRPSQQTNSYYLAHLLRSAPFRRKLEALAGGATMPNLSNTALSDLRIDIPDHLNQQAVVRRIDLLEAQVDSVAEFMTTKIAELSALKRSLLYRAFSGELTQRELEPA